MKNLIYTLALLLTFNSYGFVTLGTDNGCDYDSDIFSIQDVIGELDTNPIQYELRITKQSEYIENIMLTKTTLLKGGFANCTDANNNIASGITTINGNAVKPVFMIEPSMPTITITLDHLKIKNGKGLGSSVGGGINVRNDNDLALDLRIQSSVVSNNNGIHGGGLYTSGNATSINISKTIFLNNHTSGNGGGINCYKGHIFIDSDSGISLNQAYSNSTDFGHGGGIHAIGGCSIIFNGSANAGYGGFRCIYGNSASGHGGGIYAQLGARINVHTKNSNRALNIDDNYADSNNDSIGNGGGIYLTDFPTIVNLYGC